MRFKCDLMVKLSDLVSIVVLQGKTRKRKVSISGMVAWIFRSVAVILTSLMGQLNHSWDLCSVSRNLGVWQRNMFSVGGVIILASDSLGWERAVCLWANTSFGIDPGRVGEGAVRIDPGVDALGPPGHHLVLVRVCPGSFPAPYPLLEYFDVVVRARTAILPINCCCIIVRTIQSD